MEYVRVCSPVDAYDCKHFSRLICGSDHLAADRWTNSSQPAPSEAQVFAVLDAALEAGINLFDSSPVYVGGVEYLLGKWRASRQDAAQGKNPDGQIYMLSKAGFPFDLTWSQSLPAGKHSPELITALTNAGIFNASTPPNSDGSIPLNKVPPGTYASRLYGTVDQITNRVLEEVGHITSNMRGNVTILLMHRDDEDFLQFAPVSRAQTPTATIMQALSDPRIANHVWGFGWSNWKTARVEDSLSQARALKFPLLFNSPYFSIFEMNATRSIHAGGVQVRHADMQNPSFQRGILFNPYSPLGGWSIFDQKGPDVWGQSWKNALDHANDNYWMNVRYAIFTAANALRFQTLQKFAQTWSSRRRRSAGRRSRGGFPAPRVSFLKGARPFSSSFAPFSSSNFTMDQFANAYALAHDRMDFLTIGPITIIELERSVAALDLSKQLTSADLDYLYGNAQVWRWRGDNN